MKDSILYCFYDLAVAPASYDFLQFMQSSDLHRKRYGLDRVFFIFVPGPKNGFTECKSLEGNIYISPTSGAIDIMPFSR